MNDLDYKEVPLAWPHHWTFAHPELLFALVVPVLLLALVWGGRWLLPSRRVVLPLDRVRGRGGWWWWTAISLAESVPALLFVVAIVLLAGPQRNGPPQQKRSLTNIQFAVDVSVSMGWPFGEGTRYDASMKAIDTFLDYRKGDAFGLTFFGEAFVHWVPLTTDPSAIKCSIPFMHPRIAPPPFGGTAIANALRACKQQLAQREEGDRMVLLISDGDSYDLPGNDQELARQLNQERVSVFCVIIGGHEPQAEIINVCRLTGGEAFRVDDPAALPAFFKKIDMMKQAKVMPTIVETVDYFEPAAMLGSILLVLGTLTLYGLRYTPW